MTTGRINRISVHFAGCFIGFWAASSVKWKVCPWPNSTSLHSRDSSLFVPSHQSLVFLAMFPWKRRQERSLIKVYRKYIQKPGSLMISLLRVSSSGLSRVSLSKKDKKGQVSSHIAKKNSQSKRLSRKRKVNTPSLKPAWTIHVAATLFLLAHSPSSVILHRNEKKKTIRAKKIHIAPHISLPKSPLPAISHGLARSFWEFLQFPSRPSHHRRSPSHQWSSKEQQFQVSAHSQNSFTKNVSSVQILLREAFFFPRRLHISHDEFSFFSIKSTCCCCLFVACSSFWFQIKSESKNVNQ